jgi:hypothetical protein
MRCEYNNCTEEAYVNFLGVIKLCKKHYLIVMDYLNSDSIGRPKKIKFERIFKWLEKREYITLSEFRKEFEITYPTANWYLRRLENLGFIKKEGSIWKIMAKTK